MASLELTRTPTAPAYRVSQAGLNMLTRTPAAGLERAGILVNAASPGYTRTDMSPDAQCPVRDGADTPVWLATLPDTGPTGGFLFERRALALVRSAWRPAPFGPARRQESGPGSKGLLAGEDLHPLGGLSD
jgi:NAD(P)-dependent dehydrogenase (short-subunit alcohol dehydrogenase family)